MVFSDLVSQLLIHCTYIKVGTIKYSNSRMAFLPPNIDQDLLEISDEYLTPMTPMSIQDLITSSDSPVQEG